MSPGKEILYGHVKSFTITSVSVNQLLFVTSFKPDTDIGVLLQYTCQLCHSLFSDILFLNFLLNRT